MPNTDRAYCQLGAAALRTRLTELLREIPGVRRSADSEYLHRMRVASRRARSILRVFWECWPIRRRRAWRRELRRLTRALGTARDADVQILFLRAILDSDLPPLARPGIARLLLRKEQTRERLQGELTALLDDLERRGTCANLVRYAQRAASDGGADAGDGGRIVPFTARARARVALTPYREALLAGAACVHQPDQITAHHELRIAAKRLRYALEIFAPLAPRAIGRALKPLKELQRLLGEIHDSDVWLEALPQLAEQERRRTLEYFGDAQPFATLKPGLDLLQGICRTTRHQRYAEFVALWDRLTENGFWDELRELPPEPQRTTIVTEPPTATTEPRGESA